MGQQCGYQKVWKILLSDQKSAHVWIHHHFLSGVHPMRVKKAIGSTTRPLAILIEGGLLEALSTSSKENRKIFHLWGDLLYQFYTDCRVRRYRLSKYGQFIELLANSFLSIEALISGVCLSVLFGWDWNLWIQALFNCCIYEFI